MFHYYYYEGLLLTNTSASFRRIITPFFLKMREFFNTFYIILYFGLLWYYPINMINQGVETCPLKVWSYLWLSMVLTLWLVW